MPIDSRVYVAMWTKVRNAFCPHGARIGLNPVLAIPPSGSAFPVSECLDTSGVEMSARVETQLALAMNFIPCLEGMMASPSRTGRFLWDEYRRLFDPGAVILPKPEGATDGCMLRWKHWQDKFVNAEEKAAGTSGLTVYRTDVNVSPGFFSSNADWLRIRLYREEIDELCQGAPESLRQMLAAAPPTGLDPQAAFETARKVYEEADREASARERSAAAMGEYIAYRKSKYEDESGVTLTEANNPYAGQEKELQQALQTAAAFRQRANLAAAELENAKQSLLRAPPVFESLTFEVRLADILRAWFDPGIYGESFWRWADPKVSACHTLTAYPASVVFARNAVVTLREPLGAGWVGAAFPAEAEPRRARESPSPPSELPSAGLLPFLRPRVSMGGARIRSLETGASFVTPLKIAEQPGYGFNEAQVLAFVCAPIPTHPITDPVL